MFDFIFWSLVMLGLIVAVIVASVREKKARQKVMQAQQPQPIGDESFDDSADEEGGFDDGFGEPDPLEGFEEQSSQKQ
jgi:hypothetical protein